MTSANEIEEQAGRWVIRLENGPLGPEDEARFHTWLAERPRHRAAYLRIRSAWTQVDKMSRLRPLDGPVDADLLSKLDVFGPGRPWRRPEQRRRVWLAAAAVLAVLCLSPAAWIAFLHLQWDTYSTPIGGLERISLADGSTVHLNTNSAMRARITGSGREITLLRGEALFEVAQESRRPFIVHAAGTSVRAVGTAFSVRIHEGGRVEVLVTEGRVAIEPAPVPNRALGAGEIADVLAERAEAAQLPPDELDRRQSWTSGVLIFEGESLASVVRELNRYNPRKLVIADPKIAGLRIGGTFEATDLSSFLGALEGWLGVKVVPAGAASQAAGSTILLYGEDLARR